MPAGRYTLRGYRIVKRDKGGATWHLSATAKSMGTFLIEPGSTRKVKPDPTIPENRQRMIKMGRLAPRSAIGSMIDLINSMTIDDIRVLHQWDGEVLPW